MATSSALVSAILRPAAAGDLERPERPRAGAGDFERPRADAGDFERPRAGAGDRPRRVEVVRVRDMADIFSCRDGIRERITDAGAAGLSGRNLDGKMRSSFLSRPTGRGTVPGCVGVGKKEPAPFRWPAGLQTL